MRRFTQFLSSLFVPAGQQPLSGNIDEITLHDVLRICTTRAPERSRPALPQAGYRLSANCDLGMSGKPNSDFRNRKFGGRLAAYDLQNCAARLPR